MILGLLAVVAACKLHDKDLFLLCATGAFAEAIVEATIVGATLA